MSFETNPHPYCSCPKWDCGHHGNCRDCVIVHRGHQDHVPNCMKPMIREAAQCLARVCDCELTIDEGC